MSDRRQDIVVHSEFIRIVLESIVPCIKTDPRRRAMQIVQIKIILRARIRGKSFVQRRDEAIRTRKQHGVQAAERLLIGRVHIILDGSRDYSHCCQ